MKELELIGAFSSVNQAFLTQSFSDLEEFSTKYDSESNSGLFLLALTKLAESISDASVDNFKKLCSIISYVIKSEESRALKILFNDDQNPLKNSNLIILACIYNSITILDFIFNEGCYILQCLAVVSGKSAGLPCYEDEHSFSAFYYALRSGNLKLLDMLINNWPGQYDSNEGELCRALWIAYAKLSLNIVLISDEMHLRVIQYTVDQFFHLECFLPAESLLDVQHRTETVLKHINLLFDQVSSPLVDTKFLFILNFISSNIHTLKNQLGCTYNILPWEEIDFCLKCFIDSIHKTDEINLFFKFILTRSKLLKHLLNFAKKLEEVKLKMFPLESVDSACKFPELNRERMIEAVVGGCAEFESLYEDYSLMRDVSSLTTIGYYLKLALSADVSQQLGKLTVTRALGLLANYLIDTVECPKFSLNTAYLLFLSLSDNLEEVNRVVQRSLLSKVDSTDKLVELFLAHIDDFKALSNFIENVLYNTRMEMVRAILLKLSTMEECGDLRELGGILIHCEFDQMISRMFIHSELQNLSDLAFNLQDDIRSCSQGRHWEPVHNFFPTFLIITKEDPFSFFLASNLLKILKGFLNSVSIGERSIKIIKHVSTQLLERSFLPLEMSELSRFCSWISAILPICTPMPENVIKACGKILLIMQCSMKLKWVLKLKGAICSGKNSLFRASPKWKILPYTEHEVKDILESKMNELKGVLGNDSFGVLTPKKLKVLKNNKQFVAAVELLIYDILSIGHVSSKWTVSKLNVIEKYSPALVGKQLLDHLSHDCLVPDTLSHHSWMSLMLHARKLLSCTMDENKSLVAAYKDRKWNVTFENGLEIISKREELLMILERGDLDVLKHYLSLGVEVRARNAYCQTVLHSATKRFSVDIVRCLAKSGLNIKDTDVRGQNLLHIAAAHGRETLVKMFINEFGLNVNEKDVWGSSALHSASKRGHVETVKALVRGQAELAIPDMLGLTSVQYAMLSGHAGVVNVLMQAGAVVDNVLTYTPLHLSAWCAQLSLLRLFLHIVDVDSATEFGETPLYHAAQTGSVEVVKELVEHGASVDSRNFDGTSILHCAVKGGSVHVVNLLLQRGAVVDQFDKSGFNPLHCAAKLGHTDILEALLSKGADALAVTLQNNTALQFVAMVGNCDSVTALLDRGADVNFKDKEGTSPLHEASSAGHIDAVEILIERGADVNVKNSRDLTPLHCAAVKGHLDVVKYLVNHGAEVRGRGTKGQPVLNAAIESGNSKVFELLVALSDVNASTTSGTTALHAAAKSGHIDMVRSLLLRGAKLNQLQNQCRSALHLACAQGYDNIVKLLISHGAYVNSGSHYGETALHLAIQRGKSTVVQTLISHGANLITLCKQVSPLLTAVQYHREDCVRLLQANGVTINDPYGEPLKEAILNGFTDIALALISNNPVLHMKDEVNTTPLHFAADMGNTTIVNALLSKGAKINAVNVEQNTPLHYASKQGHCDIVEILVANEAKVNMKTNEQFTPLMLAVREGHFPVVEILVKYDKSFDEGPKTALEVAACRGDLQLVKFLMRIKKPSVSHQGYKGWGLLHTASLSNNVPLLEYLVQQGYEINCRNFSGSKPIHVAAKMGHKDAVNFFLKKGNNINECNSFNQTPLHFASFGNLELVNCLVDKGADVNASDHNYLTPLYFAACHGSIDIVTFLLDNGAVVPTEEGSRISQLAKERRNSMDIISLLKSTEDLFEAVKNNTREVGYLIDEAFINARYKDWNTVLHLAVMKGSLVTVISLLGSGADPNIVNKEGLTPLHLACQSSHEKIVKALLLGGAVFDGFSNPGKTPADFTSDRTIKNILETVKDAFKSVKSNDENVVSDLERIRDGYTLRVVMCAQDRKKRNLVAAAMLGQFSGVQLLKELGQGDIGNQLAIGKELLAKGELELANRTFMQMMLKRQHVLGTGNPAVIEIKLYICQVLYAQCCYGEVMDLLTLLIEQSEMLGPNHRDSLSIKRFIAVVQNKTGKTKEAYEALEGIYKKQKELLGLNDNETWETYYCIAHVLETLGKYEKSLDVFQSIYQYRKRLLGENDLDTLDAQSGMGKVLASQGKYANSLEVLEEVLWRKKKALGEKHISVLKTMFELSLVLQGYGRLNDAEKLLNETWQLQKEVVPYHPDTVVSQHKLTMLLFRRGKWIAALRTESFSVQRESIERTNMTYFSVARPRLNIIKTYLHTEVSTIAELSVMILKMLISAAEKGDLATIKRMFTAGMEPNEKDSVGRTALFFAVSEGQSKAIELLLSHGADPTVISKKGNTVLHIAAARCRPQILSSLLQHAPSNCREFVNTRTTGTGSTALHISAKNRSVDAVKSLLSHGAEYNAKTKAGETPMSVSHASVSPLLQLVGEAFSMAKTGSPRLSTKLASLSAHDLDAVTHAQNEKGKTIVQVAIANKHRDIADSILKLLDKSSTE